MQVLLTKIFYNQKTAGVPDIISCLQVVRIYSLMNYKEIKLCIRRLYVVFVKSENDNFIKEIKHVFRSFHSLVKTSADFIRILENSH